MSSGWTTPAGVRGSPAGGSASSCSNPIVSPPSSSSRSRSALRVVSPFLGALAAPSPSSGGVSALPQAQSLVASSNSSSASSSETSASSSLTLAPSSSPMNTNKSGSTSSFFSCDPYFFSTDQPQVQSSRTESRFASRHVQEHQNEEREQEGDAADNEEESLIEILEPLQLLPASLVDGDDLNLPVSDAAGSRMSSLHDGPSLLRPLDALPGSGSGSGPAGIASYLTVAQAPTSAPSSLPTMFGNASPTLAAGKDKVCPFFIQGICRYAEHCRYLHQLGPACPQCGFPVPPDEDGQIAHLIQCEEMTTIAEERRASSNLKCGVCYDVIIRSGRKFGLLQGCSHAFCLPCIRSWRGSLGQTKEALRACPLCRQDSHFVIPCDRMVVDPARKHDVIERYKSRLNQIECKWFNRGQGSCPFGSSCFYAHFNADGTPAAPERLQHGANADGEVEIMKPMRLSDFFG